MSTPPISRHDVDTKLLKSVFRDESKTLPIYLAAAQRQANNVSRLGDSMTLLVNCGLVVQPKSPLIPRGLRIMGQSLAGLLKLAMAGDDEATFPLDDNPALCMRGPVDTSYVHTAKWTTAFFSNILARQEPQLTWLCNFPGVLFRSSSTTGPEFVYLMVESLRSYWLGTSDIGNRIEQTRKASSKAKNDKWVQNVGVPILNVLASLAQEGKGFEKNIVAALQARKEYWNSSAVLRRGHWGFVAVELCAIARIASDRGISFAVKSDYLPMPLVAGDILK